MKYILLSLMLIISNMSFTQCVIDIPSSNGYTVHMEFDVANILTTPPCPNPNYNYKVELNYNISFINGGGSLWTLQANISCDDDSPFMNLPNNGGVGSVESNTQTRNLVVGDCGTVTPSTLNCSDIVVNIHGPGISNQNVICGTVLPIELGKFETYSINKDVYLNWETYSETNNDYFTIERSYNAIDFDSIGTINGNGTSLNTNEYSFIDQQLSDIYYYRIKQTDYNGKHSYSHINVIDLSNNITFDNNILYFKNKNDMTYQIYSLNSVLYDNITTHNDFELNLDVLNSGMYVVRVIDNETLKVYILKIFI